MIIPQHVLLTVRNDWELEKLVARVTITHGCILQKQTQTMEKRAVSRRNGGPKMKRVSLSSRATLRFMVGRIGRHLKKGRYFHGVKHGSSIFIIVLVEYLAAKVYELDGNGIRDKKMSIHTLACAVDCEE
ncbi:hypothetical protein M9H77_29769 [Catharanthus roseus]|uniref:Uncharacterized protein n=1 Tax=Catharanthus roseus TaxID=4058 RepID=A0ACB9ZWN4_CATRO|nr:hypothetical protein M9H77_29769 [Catharanthus roseus]